MITTDVKEMPEYFQSPEFDGKDHDVPEADHASSRVHRPRLHHRKRLASYKENGTANGVKLPEGLQESQKLPEPIYTPSKSRDW